LLLALSGGAIVNVAVAWAGATWSDPRFVAARSVVGQENHIWQIVSVKRSWTGSLWVYVHAEYSQAAHPDALSGEEVRAVVPGWIAYDPKAAKLIERVDYEHQWMGAGWPCTSLWCEDQPPLPNWSMWPTPYSPWENCGRLYLRVLPLRPVAFGFAINTLFYAAVLWMLFAGPGAVRRLVRRKRGRCPGCGYDLRGQVTIAAPGSRCPECGAED
jgi:hypothetical protein